MTPSEKAKFIRDLCDNCRDELMKRVMSMPDYWDGHEIRRYVADHFAHQIYEMNRARLREYRNDVLTRQGL